MSVIEHLDQRIEKLEAEVETWKARAEINGKRGLEAAERAQEFTLQLRKLADENVRLRTMLADVVKEHPLPKQIWLDEVTRQETKKDG